MLFKKIVLSVFLLCIQTRAGNIADTLSSEVRAIQIFEQMKVDGYLDEPCWNKLSI